jgi:hypothetical protein
MALLVMASVSAPVGSADGTVPSIGHRNCEAAPMVNSSSSYAAKRMRRYRQRRRLGLRCLTIQIRETEIDMLICRALLKPEMRHNKNAIINALHDHFDLTLSMRP